MFETLFAKKYKSKKVPGSGNQPFRKMDIEGNSLLWSLKATKNESFRITKKDLKEVYDAVKGSGGVGGTIIPGLAICFVEGDEPKPSDKIMAIIDMDDLVAISEQEIKLFELSKSKEKQSIAKIPSLFRENGTKK